LPATITRHRCKLEVRALTPGAVSGPLARKMTSFCFCALGLELRLRLELVEIR